MGRFIFLCVVIIACYLVYTDDGNKVITDLDHKEQYMRSMVGTKQLLGDDSVMIVDYSMWDNTYTISNGAEVAAHLFPRDTTTVK